MKEEADAGAGERIAARLARAAVLLDQAGGVRAAPLLDATSLRREAAVIRPVLEELAGRPYGRLPVLAFRGRREARLAGPWSQYLTLGLGATRMVRMAPARLLGLAVPTVLAHELAHRYAFDETVTTLRGLEASARLGAAGDARHAVAARLELARALLAAAMGEARAAGAPRAVDAFFAVRAEDGRLARVRAQWARLRGHGPAPWSAVVYALGPVGALEDAAAVDAARTGPLPFPRFPIDSLQAAACWAYTGVDALTARRRAPVPVSATRALLAGAG